MPLLAIVPEWAPNLHPLVIHFPIALLFGAVLVDLVALFARRSSGLKLSAVLLYVFGTIGVMVAYWTGQVAVDTVQIPAGAVADMTAHEDWAFYTLVFFIAYAAIRVSVFWIEKLDRMLVHIPLVLLAMAGLYLVWGTGEQGGKLVFVHGIGVQAVQELAEEVEQVRERERRLMAEEAAPQLTDDGGWAWYTGPGAEEAVVDVFTWVTGSPEDVQATMRETERGDVLALEVNGTSALLTFGEPLQSVEIRAVMNPEDFDGSVELIYNLQDEDTHHFLSLDEERIVQGRVETGEREQLDDGTREEEGWITLRATGHQGHFYGYENGRTATHAHSPVPDAGSTGIRIDGEGVVLLERIEVQPIG